MWGRLLVQSVAILWMAQAAYTKGYGAVSGVSNGHGPQLNGNHPPNSGVGRFLLPTKGVGAQSGYGGYPTKGRGRGSVSSANGAKSNCYGAAVGGTNGHAGKPHGYGAQAGPVDGRRLKGNGHGAQAGGFGGQATKGNGYGTAGGALGLNGAKQNGHGAAASAHYGYATKGNGQGAAAGSPHNYGARLGQGEAQHKPMKGYGRLPHGSVKGPGAGMAAFRGPQFARKQGKARSSNGYNGYGAQPVGGYGGGYGSAGLGLGPRFGHGGLKGPKQGYGGAAARPNGHHGKPKGYGLSSGGTTTPTNPGSGNIPNGFGAKHKGYGGAARPQTGAAGYGNGASHSGYRTKPSGYGAAAGAGVPQPYGAKPNGYGAGSKPHSTKGVGAVLPSQGAKAGYDGAAGVWNGQVAKAANAGYGILPNGQNVLSPEQLNAAPLAAVPQPAISQGLAPAAPEPTSRVLLRATPEQHHSLLSPVPQGETYQQPPQSLPALLRGKGPKPTTETAHMGPGGPAAVFAQGNPRPAVVLPEGYMTGSAVPEQKGAEEDVLFGVDRPAEGEAATESTEPLKTKGVSGLVAAISTGSVTPGKTPTLGAPDLTPAEANVDTRPEAGPERLGVKGLPAGQTGAMGIGGASATKGQGAEAGRPDCDPSGVPNGQWMKIPRPGLKAGAEASTGTITKGYSAGAGGYPDVGGAKANKPAYGAAGFSLPGLVPGYGPGLGFPYAGKPQQPGYGQGAYLGTGYENGNSYKGYGNGFRAAVQPDYAGLGQSSPNIDGKSGMGLLPFGGQMLGAEKTNGKYGIGGLQFAGQPLSPASTGAGKYGGLGAVVGGAPVPGKYGHGKLAYQAQPVALGPGIKSSGKYGLPASPYQPEHPGLGRSGQLGNYGGGEAAIALQGPRGGEAKSSGKYDNQGQDRLQPHELTGMPYQPLPAEPDPAGKPYVKGEVPAPATAAGSEGMPVDGYDNGGYINGQVQPEVVAFPAAPSLGPYPSVPSYLTGEGHHTSDPEGAAGLSLGSAPATEAQGQQPDELPRQIQIQQHLKLHFHPQKSWRGANNEQHDLKGFFGNSGYQG